MLSPWGLLKLLKAIKLRNITCSINLVTYVGLALGGSKRGPCWGHVGFKLTSEGHLIQDILTSSCRPRRNNEGWDHFWEDHSDPGVKRYRGRGWLISELEVDRSNRPSVKGPANFLVSITVYLRQKLPPTNNSTMRKSILTLLNKAYFGGWTQLE